MKGAVCEEVIPQGSPAGWIVTARERRGGGAGARVLMARFVPPEILWKKNTVY